MSERVSGKTKGLDVTMKKMLLVGFLLLFAVGILAAACGSDTTTDTTVGSTDTTAASGSSDVIKIGHIRPITGEMAMTSDKMIKAFDFALEQAGYEVAGKKIEVILGDSKGDPATAVDVARKLVEHDHVAMLVGPTTGGEQMAVANYAESVGVPLLFTNPEPMGIIANKMKWVIGAGGSEPQYASSMAVYAFEQLGYKAVNILTDDNASGHGFMGAFMSAYKNKGGTIVSEIYPPYPTSDFTSFLTTMKDADAVVAWQNGDQSIKLLTQYDQTGTLKKMPLVAAFHGAFMTPFILKALPPEVAEDYIGTLTPSPYSPLLDSPANKQFVADFTAKFGVPPEDNTDSEMYQGAQIMLAALKATNGDTTPDKLRAALVAVSIEGVEGPIKFDAETGCAIKTIYICKITKQNDAFILEPVFTYPDVSPAGQ